MDVFKLFVESYLEFEVGCCDSKKKSAKMRAHSIPWNIIFFGRGDAECSSQYVLDVTESGVQNKN